MDIADRRTDPTSYLDALTRRVNGAPDVTMQGASGYFSTPSSGLDPHLFTGMKMLPEVRRWVLQTLYHYWDRQFVHPREWSTVWLAGSGATYQWSAGRESGGAPGDLDILIGVDMRHFRALNEGYRGMSDVAISDLFNDGFRTDLDPLTAHATPPGGGTYEVTFFVNPGSQDIRNIHAYAAYDLTHDDWTVHPIHLPAGWGMNSLPAEWMDNFRAEQEEASQLLDAFHASRDALRTSTPGSPAWLNNATALHDIVRRGRLLFDSIHEDRHKAFSSGGSGFLDYYNARWQVGKLGGVVPAMHSLAQMDREAHADYDDTLYPSPVLDTEHALRIAELANLRG